MQVTIKEIKPSSKKSSVFTIIINQKNPIKLEKHKKRTIIFNKSTKIKVRKFFLESNEIEVTKNCFLEISLNKFRLGIKISLISILIFVFSFYDNSMVKLILFLLIIYTCLDLKNNWYNLTQVEKKS